MRRHRIPHRDDRGVVAIELVLILPFLLMLVMGILVLGNALSLKAQANELARRGARNAALDLTLPDGTFVVSEDPTVPNDTESCEDETNPTNFFITVGATKDVSLRSIPIVGIDILPEQITETVSMRCGG